MIKTKILQKISKKEKGFTLIELLVVIAIIGLLSTLAVVALNTARAKSRDAKRVADVKQMQTALELYFNECNGYPTHKADGGAAGNLFKKVDNADLASLGATSVYNSDGTAAGDCDTKFKTYMANVPEPPTPTDNDTDCGASQGWHTGTGVANSYYYASCDENGDCDATVTNRGASYSIEYCLGAQTGGITAGPHYANPGGMEGTK